MLRTEPKPKKIVIEDETTRELLRRFNRYANTSIAFAKLSTRRAWQTDAEWKAYQMRLAGEVTGMIRAKALLLDIAKQMAKEEEV